MFPIIRYLYLSALALVASGMALMAQDINPPAAPPFVAQSASTDLATNDSGVLEPWRASPNLHGSSIAPSPVAPESKVLQSWRATPNLNENPVEPSPPSPDADQVSTDSPLKPVTPSDLNSLRDSSSQVGNNENSLMETNNPDSIDQADSSDNQVSPPVPGSNLTAAPSMNLSTKDLVESPNEEARHLWRFVPRLFAQTLYDNNIYITKNNPVGSMLTSVGLGGDLYVGSKDHNYLNLSYFGEYNMYSEASQQDTLNQLLFARGQYAWTSLTAKYSGNVVYINGPSRDTGTFVKGTFIGNSLDFAYDYSPKTTFNCIFSQRGNLFSGSGLYNDEFYDVRVGGLYHLTPKITLGPNAVLGVNMAQSSPDQRYQSLNMDCKYELSGKVNLHARGGFVVNEYASGGQSSFGTSIMDFGTEYTPTADTRLNLVAYRNLNNAASLAGQDYIATGFTLLASHSLFVRWQPEVALGYENDQYISNLPSVQGGRVDNYYYFTPGLNYNFLKEGKLKLKIFYQIKTNVSNQEQTYGWQDNQVGVQLNSQF